MAKITKIDLVARMLEHDTFETKKAASEVLDILIDSITENIIAGNEVYLGVKLGGFSTIERAARMGVNPSTGEKLEIPAKKAAKFSASAALKAAVA